MHGYLLVIAAWMFTISFIVSNYWAFTSTPEKVRHSLEQYLAERETKFEILTNDTASLAVLLNPNADKAHLNISSEDLGFFIFSVPDSGAVKEIYWSTSNMMLNDTDVQIADGYYPFKGQNGFFELLKKNIHYDNANYVAAALIPIKWQYFIQNKYFTNSFANNDVLDNRYFIDSSGNGYPVYNSKYHLVFKISQVNDSTIAHPNPWSALLKALGMAFILIFINSVINDITNKNGFYSGIFWLLCIVALLRIITYIFPIPINLRSYELFSPLIYASSILHSSLGDLLINVLLFFWITFFIKYRHKDVGKAGIPFIFQKYKKIWGIVCLFLFAFFTINAINIICSFVLDSKIPLNVTDFFHLNAYTFIAFFIITFIILSYFNLSYFLFLPAIHAGFDLFWRAAILAISALLILSVYHSSDTIFVQLAGILWMVSYNFIIYWRRDDLPLPLVSSSYFLFWLMFYAASITLVIKSIHSKEIEEKLRIADDIALQSSNEGESLLKMAINNFAIFFYDKNFERFYSEDQNQSLKDSIVTTNFQSYLNKYESHVYTYDSLQRPLYNKDSTTFDVLNAMVGTAGKPANIPGLYVYETGNKEFNYIYRKKVVSRANSAKTLGYLFMLVSPKRFANSSFPYEMLQGASLLTDESDQSYSYAIYKNRRLISNSNDFDFSDSISIAQVPTGEYRETKDNHKKLFWYNAGNQMVVVLIENNNSFLSSITLFAYIFLSASILIVFFKIGGFFIQSKFKWQKIKRAFQFKIRFQIHATIIFISIFSFIIIGISTISFFILRFNKSNQEHLTQKLRVISNEIEESLSERLPFKMQSPNDMDNYYNDEFVEKRIVEIANLNDEEVNYYDKNGLLQASSQPYIYNQNIVSNRMQPDAYYQMHYKHRIILMQNEKAGRFQYLSGYVPLYNNDKNVFGFLNIPFLHSQSELEQEISSFLVTIINLNALIFLMAGAIAGLLTLRITKSFAHIKNEMSKINLGMENQPLEWKKNDELGDLIKEYNIMVHKLNESVKKLTQSEREGAWKEMARQVAHEIKNPLTPMKLNLQFLQRSAENNSHNIQELSKRVSALLIEQIDQLARIANDFSQFADIHNTHPENVVIGDKLKNVILLFSAGENIHIEFEPLPKHNIVYVDEKQLNRVFTNLIKNAIEASEEESITKIIIKEERIGDTVVISFQDNGHGISKEQRNKIFVPNFTTKSSGTGLGLAICKGIVERAGGQIWFRSHEGSGTTFFISLPLYYRE